MRRDGAATATEPRASRTAVTVASGLAAAIRADQKRKATVPTFRGANLEALSSRVGELVISGPAGTGKSVALLWKLHRAAETYPGSRHLMLRKTRASLTNSAMVTFEEKVLPLDHPALYGASGQRIDRRNRSTYTYPNGSVIDTGGMDEASRLFSTEYDSVYWQEVTEATLSEWQSLLRALRNNRMPYQQLTADCNPSIPAHWLKDRNAIGRLTLLESRHRDNPALWDGAAWTEYGASYMAKLESLTGILRKRLLDGIWAAAEGVVYDGFDVAVHVLSSYVPVRRRLVMSIDWGVRHPTVVQWWDVDGDGRMVLYRELYRTGLLSSDVAERVKQIHAETGEQPEAIVADSADPGSIETFCRAGLPCKPAEKGPGSIKAGIEAVKGRLAPGLDGRPRMQFVANALLELDATLMEAHLPTSTVAEMAVYQYPEGQSGAKKDDLPIDKNNHGNDAARYACAYVDGLGGGNDASVWLAIARQAAARRAS